MPYTRWLFALLLAVAALAPIANANAQANRSFTLELPAQPLGDSLTQLATQTGVQIVFFSEVTEGLQAPPLDGSYTPGDALQQLLAGTDLIAVPMDDNGSIAVQRKPPAMADEFDFDIPAQSMAGAVEAFERTTGLPITYSTGLLDGLTAKGVQGSMSVAAGLAALFDGTGVEYAPNANGGVTLNLVSADVDFGAGGSGTASVETARRGGVEEIIVTGQKKEERVQDVPIAISAFSMEQLDNQKIEGGFDLLKAIPNVSFSKTNFTGYNFQIRGIGTQAISATTDPAVAVSFNDTTLIVNRLFEQEYLDVERVEVLRGPQGTLYGRNATAGVINVIPAKPEMGIHSGEIKLETGNYSAQRIRGYYNIPLNDDTLAARIAYASTVRDGYVTNEFDNRPIDGRDLSTSRISLAWKPTDKLTANFSWERFDENDDRLRSAKSLCHRDNGPDQISGVNVDTLQQPEAVRRTVHQGCLPGSLYSSGAYDTPNGDALPFVTAGRVNNTFTFLFVSGGIGTDLFAASPPLLTNVDVFANATQSNDLRSVYSPIKPQYRAEADLYDLSLHYEWSDNLSLTSHTVYNKDDLFSTQDYSRFEASPGLFSDISGPAFLPQYTNFSPDGVFCDPQLGCSDSFRAQDISQSRSTQFNQQFELASRFDGPINFSLGVNYTQFKTKADYFFFSNVLTALAQTPPFNGSSHRCMTQGRGCISIQQDGLNATASNPYGHNFFLSRNPYELNSAGIFGETYWQATDTLKLTAGLRFTWDRKVFTPVPSQTLLADYRESGLFQSSTDDPESGPDSCTQLTLLCGIVGNAPGGIGYPADPDVVQSWRAPTGRIVVDWLPDLPFTDQTLVYASYARGYKGGGANPPSIAAPAGNFIRAAQSALAAPTFKAEYVNAYEIGTKNTVLNGSMTINASMFLYDYKDYQVSKIVDRSAVNENFDATIFGAEVEALFAPTLDWNVNAAIGHLRTRISDGELSIDLMDRTQGGDQFYITQVQNPNYNPNATPLDRADYVAGLVAPAGQRFLAFDEWLVIKPNAAQSSNCIAPAQLIAQQIASNGSEPFATVTAVNTLCAGGSLLGDTNVSPGYTAVTGAPNGGAGFFADLGGNELPTSPHFTVSLGTQYTFHLPAAWDLTGRVDWYWQGESYARVYNTEYDRLRAWNNTNFSLWAEKVDWGLRIEAYVKNAFDNTPITGSFLNSDDTGLTTNVFTLDPRLVGVSITKNF